jgi:predicted 2-oxoglutarate/Fe(II)-dependent dioxygenase YbiX
MPRGGAMENSAICGRSKVAYFKACKNRTRFRSMELPLRVMTPIFLKYGVKNEHRTGSKK